MRGGKRGGEVAEGAGVMRARYKRVQQSAQKDDGQVVVGVEMVQVGDINIEHHQDITNITSHHHHHHH